MPDTVAEERRQYKRFPVELSARYRKQTDKELKGCTVTNISRGGMGIIVYLRERIQLGSTLYLEIIFPQKEGPICADGVLKWIEDKREEMNFKGGIEFTTIDAEDKWALLDYAYDKWTEEED